MNQKLKKLNDKWHHTKHETKEQERIESNKRNSQIGKKDSPDKINEIIKMLEKELTRN